MTETTDKSSLAPAVREFVLLYASERALTAEEIADGRGKASRS